ncbi:hypothetical protein ACG83_10275 [Frankia sp. R43]|nr:hypothetical protein ACG83_10275 [Frankia sp. R43]
MGMIGQIHLGLLGMRHSAVDSLLRMRWLYGDSGLSLSSLGQAMLAEAERAEVEEPEAAAVVVVLDREDPLSYPRLVGQLVKAGAGTLVDQYMNLEQFMMVLQDTALARVLLGTKTSARIQAEIKTLCASPAIPRSVEVRVATERVHDRFLVSDDDSVYTLGGSLSTVGKSTTVITPVPESGADGIRSRIEEWWKKAEIIAPIPVEEGEDDTGEVA